MLVYDLPSVEAIYGRFGGVTGTAYLVGGLGMTALKRDDPADQDRCRSAAGLEYRLLEADTDADVESVLT